MSRFLCLVMLLMCSNVFGQVKLSEYNDSYNGEKYEIKVFPNKQYVFTISIPGTPKFVTSKLGSIGGINIEGGQLEEFINSLNEAKSKYIEWVKVAKDNGVNEMQKSTSVVCWAGGYFLYGSQWCFQFDVKLDFQVKINQVNNKTNYLLLVNTGEMISSSNRYMKADGFSIIFTNEKEIDDFISKLNRDNIESILQKLKSKEDLFKD